MLARIAENILSEAAVRGRDFGIRLGGNELAVPLPNTDEIGGVAVADRIRQSAEALQCEPLPVRVSIGGTCRQAGDACSTAVVDCTGTDVLLAETAAAASIVHFVERSWSVHPNRTHTKKRAGPIWKGFGKRVFEGVEGSAY